MCSNQNDGTGLWLFRHTDVGSVTSGRSDPLMRFRMIADKSIYSRAAQSIFRAFGHSPALIRYRIFACLQDG